MAWWKLRPDNLQDKFGEFAPKVIASRGMALQRESLVRGASERDMQDAWLGAALEQLAQMCGSFLKVTSAMNQSKTTAKAPAGAVILPASLLQIGVHIGDALDLCDALVAVTDASPQRLDGGVDGTDASASSEDVSRPVPFAPLAFQQGSLHPLMLRVGAFESMNMDPHHPVFDVVNTSNLSDHLGEWYNTGYCCFNVQDANCLGRLRGARRGDHYSVQHTTMIELSHVSCLVLVICNMTNHTYVYVAHPHTWNH